MMTFLNAVKHVRKHYPMLWNHSRVENRRIMVEYHLPYYAVS